MQESTETNEPSQHVTQTRRLRKNRLKKTKPLRNLYFHGERAKFLLWQSLQWILREELRVLIEEMGWPVELEGVVRDLWAMLLASSGVPNAPGDFENGEEPAGSYCGPREGERYIRKGRRKKVAKDEDGDELDDRLESEDGTRAGSESDSASTSGDESDGEEEEQEQEGRIGVKENGRRSTTEAEPPPPEPSLNPYEAVKAPQIRDDKRAYSTNPRSRPRMEFLLIVIYLGCTTLRLPIFLRDITKCARSHLARAAARAAPRLSLSYAV